MSQPLLRVTNVSKIFGATRALSGANLDIAAGEIHSLLGRNGAGKSTLVNIIAGVYPQTEGDVVFDGHDLRKLDIFARQKLGIRLVPQHENSFPDLTVAENIFAGDLPKKNGLVDWSTINEVAAQELAAYGVDADPRGMVRDLSSIDARKLNIIRSMHSGARLIILDEPTTALTTREREELFAFVRDLKAMGTAFIFISHYLGEVLDLSDSISVLRDGLMYPVEDRASATQEHLGELVAGGQVELTRRRVERPDPSDVLVQIRGLRSTGVEDVDLGIRRGEVLGIIGFPGSGAREFCRALFGADRVTSGTVHLEGRLVRLSSPRQALREGIAYISFDRHREGIMPLMDVNENIGISSHAGALRRAWGFLDLKRQRQRSQQYRDELKIKCNTIFDPMDSLSGGNQQKVLVSRLLSTQPSLLILDEPTVGIDILSREEIISKVLELTRTGMSALYLTNDYEELLRVADRLVFFDEGRVASVVDNDGLTIEQLTQIRDSNKEAASA